MSPYRTAARPRKPPEPERYAGAHADCVLDGHWWWVRFRPGVGMYICDGCARAVNPQAFAAGLSKLVDFGRRLEGGDW